MAISRRFALYNQVLQLDGGNNHFARTEVSYDGLIEELNITLHQEKMRPILYAGLHLVHEEVRQKVRELDSKISTILFLGQVDEWPVKEAEGAHNMYTDMIRLIESHYETA